MNAPIGAPDPPPRAPLACPRGSLKALDCAANCASSSKSRGKRALMSAATAEQAAKRDRNVPMIARQQSGRNAWVASAATAAAAAAPSQSVPPPALPLTGQRL